MKVLSVVVVQRGRATRSTGTALRRYTRKRLRLPYVLAAPSRRESSVPCGSRKQTERRAWLSSQRHSTPRRRSPSWASIAKTLFALYAGLWAVDLVSRALSIGAVRSALWGLVVAAPVALCLAVLVFLAISSNHRLLWRARFDRRPYRLCWSSGPFLGS